MLDTPVLFESTMPINNDIYARYTLHKEGYEYTRPNLENWFKKPLKEKSEPVNSDVWLQTAIVNGVDFETVSHASICIDGSAIFRFTKDNQEVYECKWAIGDTNLAAGSGFLPKLPFTRIFEKDYTTCCILPVAGMNPDIQYDYYLHRMKAGEIFTPTKCDFALSVNEKRLLSVNESFEVKVDTFIIAGKRV